VKILVTGASGFLGSWIIRILSLEHEVTALVRDSSNLIKLSNVPSIKKVVLNSDHWANFIKESSFDALILNDWEGVGNEYRNSPLQFKNVERIERYLRAARESNLQTIIGVGSQAELGQVNSITLESQIDNPTTLYGYAKVEIRKLSERILAETGSRFIWMRIFSTYGPLDDGSWMIPNLVDSLSTNKRVAMTLGGQEWSYLHAYDLAMSFSYILRHSEVRGVVNVGNPQTILIRDAALKIGEILGKTELIDFGALQYRADQVFKLSPKCETLSKLGWEPKIAFDVGIRQTIDWLLKKQLGSLYTIDHKSINFNIPTRV
jgi:nucleoside-diphosphate-sugar epimerase